MGLLDDAIREHLELMRRRGADPTEIAKAEAEALSPPVREVEEPESHPEDDDLLAGTAPVPADDSADASEDEEIELESPASGGDPDWGDQATEHFDVLGHSEAAEEAALEDDDLDDPALRSPDAEAGADDLELAYEDELEEDGLDDRPVGSVTADTEPADDEIEGQQSLGVESDELEGTPDFLAESPDHDKLWFEQSGPRDFDFDGEDGK